MRNKSTSPAIRLRSPLALLLTAQFASAAFSQGAPSVAATLPTVTISAGRGTQLKDMDISTTVITREQVLAAPQATVDQIVNRIPGIFVPTQPSTQLHPTGQVLNIRGFGTSTNGLTLVLLDGVPINDPYFRTVNWAQIPKDLVERIEVIRGGGATSLWGNMAMGGVINIVTRQPAPGERHVQASYGSFDTRTLDASAGVALNDTTTLGLSYDGSDSDGYFQVPAQYRHPAMVAPASRVNNLNATLAYTPDAKSRYFARLQASQTREDGLTYAIANNQWDTYRFTFGGVRELAPRNSLNLNGWVMRGAMDTQNASNPGYTLATPASGTPYVSQRESATYRSAGASAYLQTAYGSVQDLKIGADARTISIDDPIHLYSPAAFLGDVTAQATHRFFGLFAQGTYRPKSIPLDITLGLREDFWRATDASTHGNFQGSAIQDNLPDASSAHFDPRIGAKYYLGDNWALRAAAYRNFSAPGVNQMYRSFVSGSNYTVPNTALQPQTNKGYELGADFRRGGVDVGFTAFHNRVSNYIDYATAKAGCSAANAYCGTSVTAASTLKQYVNAGDAVLKGFEVLGTWRASPSVAFRGGFSRTIAHLTRSNVPADPVGRQLGQVPPWMANAGVTWDATSQLAFTLAVKGFPDYWNTTSHSQVNQGAVLADVGVVYRYRKGIELFAAAQNIGNRSYYDQGLSYNANGTVNTSASGTIPALGMPLNVTAGLRATF
jgi:outer membrane receptor protein involved in Fe transport